MTTCIYSECERAPTAGGYCAGHYQQQRRGETLRPLRTSPGDGEQISLRLSRELLASARACADGEGLDVREWIRRAMTERLRSQASGRRRPT